MMQPTPKSIVFSDRRRHVLLLVSLLVIVLTVALVLTSRGTGSSRNITIATGGEGGTYIRLGRHFATILQRRSEIARATAVPTQGSRQNIAMLVANTSDAGHADVALVLRPALMSEAKERQGQLSALAFLYSDVLQVLVRTDSTIASLADLRDRRVYVGAPASGTRMIAHDVLLAFDMSFDDADVVDRGPDGSSMSFRQAVDMLVSEASVPVPPLEAAFVVAGMPTDAVRRALDSGRARLLDLAPDLPRVLSSPAGRYLSEDTITAGFYEHQPDHVDTLSVETYLVCRRDLDPDAAYLIVQELFENLPELLEAHTKAHDINLTRAFKDWPHEGGFIALHEGARRFRRDESRKVLIATGTLDGPYYELGHRIQVALEQYGIPARAVQTSGSLENARLLSSSDRDGPVLAIMQLDAALAAMQGRTDLVYRLDEVEMPLIGDLRRIATAHMEALHVVVRRSATVEQRGLATLAHLLPSRTCIGPTGSGTALVVRSVLESAEILDDVSLLTCLPVPEMVDRMNGGELDAGCFVGRVPSRLLSTVLNENEFKLLSIDPETRSRLATFEPLEIPAGVYGCLPEGSEPVNTIGNPAVVVTTAEADVDVATVTRAIFENAAYLGYSGPDGANQLARPVGTLKLHPDAEAVYRQLDLRPSHPGITIQHVSVLLGISVVLIAGYQGMLKFKRDRTGNEIGRRILAVSLESAEPTSVAQLWGLRAELQECVRRRWWRLREIDRSRWRYLDDLVVNRIAVAKENLMRALVASIYRVPDQPALEAGAESDCLHTLEDRIWHAFEDGELDGHQKAMLRELIAERSARGDDADDSGDGSRKGEQA